MNNEQPTTENTEVTEPEAETRPLGSVSKTADELAAENDRLMAELHMRAAIYDIESRLVKAGARSPKLLAAQSKESFQFTEEGGLTNAEAVIDHLRKTWPEQFATPSIDASAGRASRPTLTKEALARMTPAEIQRLDWNEVKATLAS